MGKSCAMSHLILQTHEQFDLIISFCGNRHCQPALTAMIEKQFDDRFFFDTYEVSVINKLLDQQSRLLDEGCPRNILVVMDDCVLNSEATESLSHLAMRGRHFRISLMCASVSYTAISKRVRRSLDYLFLFNSPMNSDMKLLSYEYTNNMQTAMWGLKNLDDHECMIFTTCQKQQILYNWKATLVEAEHIRRLPSLSVAKSEILGHQVWKRPQKTDSLPNQNKSPEIKSSDDAPNKSSPESPESETVSSNLESTQTLNESTNI